MVALRALLALALLLTASLSGMTYDYYNVEARHKQGVITPRPAAGGGDGDGEGRAGTGVSRLRPTVNRCVLKGRGSGP